MVGSRRDTASAGKKNPQCSHTADRRLYKDCNYLWVIMKFCIDASATENHWF